MLQKLFLAAMTLLLLSASAQAQEPGNSGTGCHLNGAYMMSHAVPPSHIPAGVIPPYLFPPEAKDTCGKIIFFYEDVAIALSGGASRGFAEGSGIGDTRRATMCAVSQYIQSVFDFSRVPGGSYLRVIVSQSYSDIRPATSAIKGQLSGAWPYFDAAHAIGDTVNGYFHDFVTSGIDPLAGPVSDSSYHGEMFMNFDSVWLDHSLYATGTERSWGGSAKVEMNNGLSDPHNCAFDLFSIGLHSLGHIMGWLSWDDKHTITTFYTSKLQQSIWMGPAPHGLYDPFAGLMPFVKPSPPALPYRWANDRKAPENYVFDPQSHHLSITGGQYTWFNRISPGDLQHYVMEYPTITGVAKRNYLKGDLRVFTENIGYKFAPGFLTDSAVMLANSIPWSSKMSYRYNLGMDVEQMPADFTMTNNIGSSLLIHLAADTSLKDNNGDTLRIYPGSLVNFRGCGSGGNNHALLSVGAGGTEITYTPRPGFYGRAQFGYTLWDGKEKGAFILTTIDVEKGTNVSVPPGGNFIQNGDGEEGEQVKIKGTDEGVNNTLAYYSEYTASRWGGHYTDGQYYSAPAVIHNSYSECGYTTPYTFGSLYQSFPWPTPDSTVLLTYLVGMRGKNPAPNRNEGERYTNKKSASFLLLNDTIRNCRRYRFEFDMARMEDTIGGDKDTLYLGLTAKNMIAHPTTAYLLQRYKPQLLAGLRYDHWEHYSLPFTYCNDTPATVLYLRTAFAHMMDNLSIVELPDTLSIEVSAFADELGSCRKRLYTDVPDMGCPMSYTWKKLDGTLVGADTAVEVDATALTTYIVTVSDGCGHTGSDTIAVAPCRCSTGDVFGTSSFTTLSGTVPSTLSPGLYYAATDLTITGTTTFNNAILLMEPAVAINVSNTAKLILDGTHIFTCPDTNRLWAGIRLQSSGSSSARIEVKNGSLIEDADFAIDAKNLKAPPSGNIIDITNSTFNRNLVSVSVNGAYSLGSAGTYPIKIENSLFTARHFDTMAGYPFTWAPNARLREELVTVSNTKAPYKISRDYAKAYLKNDTMAYMGIQFYNTGNTLVPGSAYAEVLIGEPNFAVNRNIIDNMQFGFHSNNSNTTLVNTHIINIGKRMVPDDDTNHSYATAEGMGIISQCSGTRTNRVKIGAGANAGVKLYDCYSAIHMEDVADVEIKAAVISSSHTLGNKPVPGTDKSTDWYSGQGITLIGNNNHLKWSVTQNTISNVNHGIYVWIGNPTVGAITEIKTNNLFDQNPSAKFTGLTALQYMLQGITVAGSGSSYSNTVSIKENTLTGVFNGIELNHLKSAVATVENNQIQITDKTMSTIGTPQYGISALVCQDATISANTVSTTTLGSKGNAINIKGFYASQNTNLRLCGNFTNRIGSAFVFDGKVAQVGTRWIANTINDGWRGMTLASDIGDQGFMYNWRTVPLSTFYGPVRNKWIGYGGAKEQTVTISYTNTMLSKLYVRDLPSGTVERPTINISDSGFPFPYFYRYTFGSESIRVPVGPPSDANCHGALYEQQTFPRPELSGPFVTVRALGRLVLADSLGYDNTYRVNQWCNQLAVYELAMIHPELRDSSGTLDNFMIHATGSRFSWLTAINQAIGTGNIAAAQSLINTPVTAMGRVVVNNDVTITDYTEANGIVSDYLAYYNTYIRMLQATTTPTDTVLLGTIARKCPPVDGPVVYKARALYQLLRGSAEQYIDDNCAYGPGGHGQYRTVLGDAVMGSSEQDYTLFPNPNEGIFSIRQTMPTDKTVEVKIYNTLGQELYRETVQFRGGAITFRLDNAMPGLYLVCITDEQHKVVCLKFNVR